MKNPSICFVALKAYGLLAGRGDIRHVGGAEQQQVLLARELLRRRYPVSFVVLDHGQAEQEEIDGIRIHRAYRSDTGLPRLRFLHPRVTGLWIAMRRAGADIYYQRGAETETGLVAGWCRWNLRKMVFAVAHDTNCYPALPELSSRVERCLYRYGLKRASLVIVQTERQRQLLQKGFGISPLLVRSCCEIPEFLPGTAEASRRGSGPRVLWIGRLSHEKRPEWAIALAKDFQRYHFDMVGQCNADSAYGAELIGRLQALPNVQWHGHIPHAQMAGFYRRADVLLCSSESEGFPNVFLEAWSHARPVLSTVDPDGLIDTHSLGQTARDYQHLKRCLADLETRPEWWTQAGRRAREYVAVHHTLQASVDDLERSLCTLMGTPFLFPAEHGRRISASRR